MVSIGLSRGPMTFSTRDFRGSGPSQAFRGLEDALTPVLKVSGMGADRLSYRRPTP